MIATITNQTANPVTLPVLNLVLAPFEVLQLQRTFTYFNSHLTGPLGQFFQNLVATGTVRVAFNVEESDLYVPAPEENEVPVPNGPYFYPRGTPVALKGSILVPADAADPAAMPCIGLYTGPTTNQLRVLSFFPGFVGLPADAPIYVAPGGGVTATPPSAPGQISQYIGRSVGTTTIFVDPMTPVNT